MTEYFLLYCFIGLIGYYNYRVKAESGSISRTAAWLCFCLVFLLMALRHSSMGRDLGYYADTEDGDLPGYLGSFSYLASCSWKSFWSIQGFLNYEYGYILLNRVIGTIWNNRQFLIAVCALLSLMPVAYVIEKKSCSPVLSWVLFLALPIFEILYSGLRQGISLGICAVGLLLIQQKKPIHFFLTVLLACCFHSSAWVFLLAYPVYHIRLTKLYRAISMLLIPVVFLFRRQIFNVMSLLMRESAPVDNNGAIGLLLLLVLIYGLCSMFADENDAQQNGWLNIFFLCCVCQVFANIFSIALRIGYYFMLPVVLFLPSVLDKLEWRLRIIAKLAVIVFFIAFGLRCIYNSSWSMAYPYYWFWEVRG